MYGMNCASDLLYVPTVLRRDVSVSWGLVSGRDGSVDSTIQCVFTTESFSWTGAAVGNVHYCLLRVMSPRSISISSTVSISSIAYSAMNQ